MINEDKLNNLVSESNENFNPNSINIFKDLPVAIYMTDKNGYIIYFNKAVEILWGRRPKIGIDLWCGSLKMFQTDGTPLPFVECPIAIALKEKKAIYGHTIIIEQPDGTRRIVKPHPRPLFDEDGMLTGAVNMLEDVTEQTNKENKEKSLSTYSRNLIEASLDPLVTINTSGKITDMNEAMLVVTDKSRKSLTGTEFKKYFTDPQQAEKIYQEVFEKGFVIDYPLTMKDGKLIDVLFNGSVYKDEKGTVIGAVVVARDVTARNKIEKELIEARVFAELATEIAEEAKIKAEEAVKSKQQFLSNMSHEIRTPMNAIIGFSKVMLKTDLTTKQIEYLNAIKTSGDALIVLINDILDLAKVDSGKMIFEEKSFSMEKSISAMVHLFETRVKEKNLLLVKEYDVTIPEVLMGDPARLHQIILNLLSNAIKFTTNGKITFKVHLIKQDNQSVSIEFSVTDTGIGIHPNKISTIFENFQQASSDTSRLFGGTGLGLAIVKNLVESQNGSIDVKSKLDEGSTFSFILNFKKTNEVINSEIETEEPDKEIKVLKVLVVEDIPLNQLLMKTILDDLGFERDIAENGKIAIEKLKIKSYDIILMDLQMPEMNGFEATEYIRNTLKSKIPIIALTADVTTVDLTKCKAIGMNDYVSKPVNENLLYEKIISLVRKPANNKVEINIDLNNIIKEEKDKKLKYIDLKYLNKHTKSNPTLIMEMISLYLKQTPTLIDTMKQSLQKKDWNSLQAAAHKIIPSFAIMGIHVDFENVAKKVHEYANSQLQTEVINDLVLQLENVCMQACKELEEEYNILKNTIK